MSRGLQWIISLVFGAVPVWLGSLFVEGGLSSEVRSKKWCMVFVNNQTGFSLMGRFPIMANGHRTSEWLM